MFFSTNWCLSTHSIHAAGFRSLAEGEDVEFSTEADHTGRIKATKVTGPNGAFVQGAPRRFVRGLCWLLTACAVVSRDDCAK